MVARSAKDPGWSAVLHTLELALGRTPRLGTLPGYSVDELT